jgi:hypothetical protein
MRMKTSMTIIMVLKIIITEVWLVQIPTLCQVVGIITDTKVIITPTEHLKTRAITLIMFQVCPEGTLTWEEALSRMVSQVSRNHRTLKICNLSLGIILFLPLCRTIKERILNSQASAVKVRVLSSRPQLK